MNYLFKALVVKLQGEIEVAKANLLTYQRNPVGIGEHAEIVQAMELEVEKIAQAQEKIEIIQEHFPN
jgi:hypothetical protein|tara:strand:- start:167 stop:367 length:201 start_codon:yes stop_codon:yes gene_type:complete